MIEVFQTVVFGETPNKPEDLVLVATVPTMVLDRAYYLTNSIDAPWFLNPDLLNARNKTRSTSMGDFMRIVGTNTVYRVAMCGFDEVSSELGKNLGLIGECV